MVIFTFPYKDNKSFYIAPETAICRESDYYYTDEVRTAKVVPFVFAKISRAGKCIASKFAGRHYTVVGHGIHLKPELMTSAVPREAVEALCKYCDNNIFLGNTSDKDEFMKEHPDAGVTDSLDKAIETASEYVSLRVGDIIAIESEPLQSIDVVGEKQTLHFGDIVINIR